MDGQNRRGRGRDGLLYGARIQVPGVRIAIGEHRREPVPRGGVARGEEGEAGHDHFAANAECFQRQHQAAGATRHGDAIAHAEPLAHGGLQSRDQVSIGDQPILIGAPVFGHDARERRQRGLNEAEALLEKRRRAGLKCGGRCEAKLCHGCNSFEERKHLSTGGSLPRHESWRRAGRQHRQTATSPGRPASRRRIRESPRRGFPGLTIS